MKDLMKTPMKRWRDRVFVHLARAFGFTCAAARLDAPGGSQVKAILLGDSEESCQIFAHLLAEEVHKAQVAAVLKAVAEQAARDRAHSGCPAFTAPGGYTTH